MKAKTRWVNLYRKVKISYLRNPLSFFAIVAAVTLLLWTSNALLMWFFLGDLGKAGTAGDSFGAVNSLFTGLAFIGLIGTLVLQQRELRLQRRELRLQRNEVAQTRVELRGQKEQMELQNEHISKQAFENTFFNMLKVFNDFVTSISGPYRKDAGVPRSGRDQISYIVNSINHYTSPSDAASVAESYKEKYNGNVDDFGAYLRVLYNIVKFVGISDVESKKIYTNIIRAQLSESELIAISFNSSTQAGEKFRPLIEKFELLKHCPETFGNVKVADVMNELRNG